MPNIKSQKKRVLITKKENTINRAKRTAVRNAIKKYQTAIANGNIELANELLPKTISVIDRAKSDGVYKKNNAARKISKISKALTDLKKEA